MTFQKGMSGNPGGRAKTVLEDGRTLAEIAREHTLTAVETLVTVMTDDEAPPAARTGAASAILDRGWGRAPATIEVDANLKVDDDGADFAAWRAVLQTAAAAIASGAERPPVVAEDGET